VERSLNLLARILYITGFILVILVKKKCYFFSGAFYVSMFTNRLLIEAI